MTLPTPTQLPESGVETRPIEVVTPIKPSEALRLGRLVRPRPVTGTTWSGKTGACAVGAMAAALGYGGGANDDNAPWEFGSRYLWQFGVASGEVANIFEGTDSEYVGRSGDEAVLAFLEARGL